MESRSKNYVAWNLLDPITMGKAKARQLPQNFESVMALLEEIHAEKQSDHVHAKYIVKGDPMDVSAVERPGGADAPAAAEFP